MSLVTLRWTAVASLIGLITLTLAWEGWIAPLRPGGSWLVLKALPLLLPLRGLLHGRRYTFQWATLLSLAYLTEGLVRAWSDSGASRAMAMGEVILALAFFAAAALYARASAPSKITDRSAG